MVSRRHQNYFRRVTVQQQKHTPWQKTSSYVEKRDLVNETEPSVSDTDSIEHTEDTNKENESNVLGIKNQNDSQDNIMRKMSDETGPNEKTQSPADQTILIFDWDDTLLCTSFLTWCHNQGLSEVEQKQNIQEIEASVKRLLELAIELGHTFIVTNSAKGWVEYSANKWAPSLLPILRKIRIISARTKYEEQFPDEVDKWKIQAFLDVQKQFDSQKSANLISIGDQDYEIEAVHVMGKEFSQALIKTIKFLESPSPENLLKQLQLLTPKFEQIVKKTRNFAGGAVGK